LNNLIKRPSGGKDNNYIIYIDYDWSLDRESNPRPLAQRVQLPV
jgi:hypothetical protein